MWCIVVLSLELYWSLKAVHSFFRHALQYIRIQISKPPPSVSIEPQDPQRRGRRRDGQHIAETEGKTQVGPVYEEAPTARSGSHGKQRLWPDNPFAQAIATAVAIVRLPHQVL